MPKRKEFVMHNQIAIAAKASGMTPEEFIQKVKNLLSPARCRDTEKQLFTPVVRKALFLPNSVATL